MCIARTSDKDILNLEICDHLFIKRLSEPDKIDINATDNKVFVFKQDIWFIHNWDQPAVFKRKCKSVIDEIIIHRYGFPCKPFKSI